MVLETFIQDQVSLIHCFGPEAWQNIMVVETVAEASHLMVARKQSEREKESSTRYFQRHIPPLTCFLQLGPISSITSPTFENSATGWGPSLQHMCHWETSHIKASKM
jgi:hypothetical protein